MNLTQTALDITPTGKLRRSHGLTLAQRLQKFSMPEPNTGCHLWFGALNVSGYGILCYERRVSVAHRLSWETYHGPIPNEMWVLHKCDVRPCINPDHLFLGTVQDNNADKIAKGRARALGGEMHNMRKLTAADVSAIRASTEPRPVLAERYGVSVRQIYNILSGKHWPHVREDNA